MTFLRPSLLSVCTLLPVVAGVAVAGVLLFRRPPDTLYSGKRLSVWVDEVWKLDHLANVANTNYPEVQALRTIGTNAIPWLVRELRTPLPFAFRLNKLLQKQRVIMYRFPVPANVHLHQSRARAGFWALGEIAAPAIPSVVNLLEQQPEFAPSALAGIGARALPALEHCITNTPPYIPPSARQSSVMASALGSLYVALDVGRISRSEAAYLLPTVRAWAQASTNGLAAYWADGVLRELSFEH